MTHRITILDSLISGSNNDDLSNLNQH